MYEIQYESLPSVGLTIYVILVTLTDSNIGESTSTALHASILTSLMSISYSSLRIFIKNITKDTFAVVKSVHGDKNISNSMEKIIRSRFASIDHTFASQMHLDTPQNSKQSDEVENTSTPSMELVVENDRKDNNFAHFSQSMIDINDTNIIYDEKCNIDSDTVDQFKWSGSDAVNSNCDKNANKNNEKQLQFEYFCYFENLHFVYAILYCFMLTDFYCRVFPNLILFCLFESMVSSYQILSLLIALDIVIIFAIEFVLSKRIRKYTQVEDNSNSNSHIGDHDSRYEYNYNYNQTKDVLYYLFVLYFSSLVNLLFSLPTKRFSLKIDFKRFIFAQMVRLFLGFFIEIIVLSVNKIEILPFLHGLYACSFCANIIILWLMHKAKHP